MQTDVPLWLYITISVAPPIFALIGVIIIAVVSTKANSKNLDLKIQEIEKTVKVQMEERQFKISQGLLERTVICMQQGYGRLMEINDVLYRAAPIAGMGMTDHADKAKVDYDAFVKRLHEIRIWYNENCFYLPKNLRGTFSRLIMHSIMHVHELFYDDQRRKDRDVWVTYMETYRLLDEKFNSFLEKYSLFEINKPN